MSAHAAQPACKDLAALLQPRRCSSDDQDGAWPRQCGHAVPAAGHLIRAPDFSSQPGMALIYVNEERHLLRQGPDDLGASLNDFLRFKTRFKAGPSAVQGVGQPWLDPGSPATLPPRAGRQAACLRSAGLSQRAGHGRCESAQLRAAGAAGH